MTYQQALQKLYSLNEFNIKLGLQNIQKLLHLLGDPQRRFPAIHIAGTNGKGSVCAFLASTLKEGGHQVGLFTSPHLIDIRERIQINGHLISKKAMENQLKKIFNLLAHHKELSPTFFEILTALAFDYFAEKKVTLAVIETGLGGRLDATNLCQPIVCGITRIAFDHEKQLGKTLLQIAQEKGGIIKTGVPLVCGENKRRVLNVLQKKALEKKAPWVQTPSPEILTSNTSYEEFDYQGTQWPSLRLKIPLLGKHQVKNAAMALALLEVLALKGVSIEEKAIQKGFSETKWPGRFQILTYPNMILDGSHNEEGVEALLNTLKEKRIPHPVFIFGMMKDKKIEKITKKLYSKKRTFFLVQTEMERSASTVFLRNAFKKHGNEGEFHCCSHVEEAIQKALEKKQTVCVTGSLYLVGESLKILKKRFPEIERKYAYC